MKKPAFFVFLALLISSPALAMYEATTVGVTFSTIMGIKQKIDCEKEHQKNGTKGVCKDLQDQLNEEKAAEDLAAEENK